MNIDELSCPDSLTERVLAAVFEVSNTLGAGFLEKVYERALACIARYFRGRTSFFHHRLQGPQYWRVLRGYPRRKRAGSRTEMRRTLGQRTHRAMSQLSASVWPDRLLVGEFPEAKS